MDGVGKLTLKRTEGQTIVIEDVVIEVKRVRTGYVQLVVYADRGLRVMRGEVQQRMVSTGEIDPIPSQEYVRQ